MGQDLGYLGETVIIGLAGLPNQPSFHIGGYLDPLIILRVVQRPVSFSAFQFFVFLGSGTPFTFCHFKALLKA